MLEIRSVVYKCFEGNTNLKSMHEKAMQRRVMTEINHIFTIKQGTYHITRDKYNINMEDVDDEKTTNKLGKN